MNQIWNRKYCWFPKLNFFVSSTKLMLCPMFLSPFFLEGGWVTVSLPKRTLLSKSLLDFWTLFRKRSYKYFGILIYYIRSNCGGETFSFCFHLLVYLILCSVQYSMNCYIITFFVYHHLILYKKNLTKTKQFLLEKKHHGPWLPFLKPATWS